MTIIVKRDMRVDGVDYTEGQVITSFDADTESVWIGHGWAKPQYETIAPTPLYLATDPANGGQKLVDRTGADIESARKGRTAAQLAAAPTAKDIAMGDSTVFYMTTDPTRRFLMSADHTKFVEQTTAQVDPLTGVIRKLLGFSVPNPVVSVGCLGDSITAMCFDYSGSFNGAAGDTSLSNYGWLFWWKFFTRSPLSFTKYAVAGATSDDVVNLQLAAALEADHDIYTLEIGVNDAALTGAQTLANITTIYQAVRVKGSKLLIWTPTPTESFSTSKSRFSVINSGIRALAVSDPACVKVMDAKSAMSNPASADGAAYDAASGFDLTYDTTHPNCNGAMILGRLASIVAAPWTGLYKVGPHSNGDTKNLLVNAALGGIAGTLPTGGSGAVADSWTGTRSAATVTTKCYKVKSVPRILEAGATPALGTRCKVLGISDYHYIVIGTGTAVTTLPSSTTLFSETQPDGAGGTTYLCLPANDKPGMQSPYRGVPYESQYLDVVDSTTVNTSVNLNQTVSTGFSVGDKVRASCEIEMLESAWQAFALRISATTSGSVKTADSFGPSYNISNAALMEPNLSGLCETLDTYQVPENTANLIFRFYIFNRTAGIHTRLLIHHPVMENLSA